MSDAEPALLIFDWDGTLMDSEAAIVEAMVSAYRETVSELPSYAAIRHIIGLSLDDAVQRLTPELHVRTRQCIVQAYRDKFSAVRDKPELFAGVRATLEHLYGQGYLLAVATGKSRRGLNLALKHSGIGELFHETRTADESAPKPEPRMLEEILRSFNLAAHQALMIGDTVFDLEMAKAAGMPCAAVTYGAHDISRLRALGPAFELNEFPRLIDELQVPRPSRQNER